jgi:hypothetical protein
MNFDDAVYLTKKEGVRGLPNQKHRISHAL